MKASLDFLIFVCYYLYRRIGTSQKKGNAMTTVRTAVLIHGCHLQANLAGKDWDRIVWGMDSSDPTSNPTLEGRGTMGLHVAFHEDAELIIFSTGASERGGVLEGEFTYSKAAAYASSLKGVVGFRHCSKKIFLDWLKSHAELDLESQNTAEECERNFRSCAMRGIERVILVSSPWHIQRCHTEALKVAEKLRAEGVAVPDIVAVASHGSTEGIVILEPPHRGDRPVTKWHLLGRRLFKIADSDLEQFERKFDELLADYGA